MIKTLQGNMLEQISAVPDGTIDLLLTDPPYNISNDGANPQWIDPETGKVRKREDGKVLKPEGWTPPNLEPFTRMPNE